MPNYKNRLMLYNKRAKNNVQNTFDLTVGLGEI